MNMKTLMEINQFKSGEVVYDIYGDKWVAWGWERPEGAFEAHREELREKTIQLKDPDIMFFNYVRPQELIRYTDKVRKVSIPDNVGHAIYNPDGEMVTLMGEYIIYVGDEIINKYYTFEGMGLAKLTMRAGGVPVFVEAK